MTAATPPGWTDDDVRLRLLHVDDDRQSRETLAAVVDRQADVAVASVATPGAGEELLGTGTVDCLVVEWELPGSAGLVDSAPADVPYVLLTDADPQAIAADVRGPAAGLVEKGAAANCEFLVEKARSATGVGRAEEETIPWQRETRTSVGESTDLLVAFLADGDVTTTNHPPEVVVDGVDEAEGAGLHDRLATAFVNGEQYLDRVGDGLDGYVCETDSEQYLLCWRESLPATVGPDAVELYRDVTDEVTRKDRLRRAKALIEDARDGIYMLDADGEIVYCNDAFPELFDATRDDVIGGDATERIVEEDLQRGQQATQELIQNPEMESRLVEMDFWTVSDERVTIAINFTLTPFGEDGSYTGLMGVARDVTERERREKRLAEYRRLVEDARDPMYVLDEEQTVQLANEAFADLAGEETTTIRDSHVEDVLGQHWADEQPTAEALCTADGSYHSETFEVRLTTEAGERFFEVSVGPLATDEGARGTVNSVREVTAQHRRRAEIRRRESELRRQNEFLERFSSMVSHDLRNPLGIAQTYAGFAAESGDPDDFDAVADALDRMDEMIDDLLTFARMGGSISETERLQVDNLAADAWEHVETGDATLSSQADTAIEGDRRSLLHVFENLFRNSVEHGSTSRTDADASADAAEHTDGPVTVEVGTLDDRPGLYVADDGVGIPAEERERVFDQGYTTSDQGTGFGLAIVRDIVEAHGWHVGITTSDAGGARFEVDLTGSDDNNV